MTNTIARTRALQPVLCWCALGTLCVIWGTTWIAIKIDLQTIAPLTALGLRFVIAAALLFGVAAWRKQLRDFRKIPWQVIGMLAAFMFGVSYVCTYFAETHLESGIVAVLFATLPFFGFGFALLLLGERTTLRMWLGAAGALAGVAVVSLGGRTHGGMGFMLCALGAAASAALGNVYAKKHAQHDPIVTLPPAMLIAGGSVLALGLFTEHTAWSNALTPLSLGALFYLAVVGSAAAFLLLMWTLQRLPAGTVNVSSLLYPIVAIVAGALFGNEHFTARDLMGTACVLGGLFLTSNGRTQDDA